MNSRVINKYIIKERLNDINLKEQQINDLVTYFAFGTRKQWRSFTSSSDNKTNIVKDHIKNLKDRVFSSKKSFANKRGEEFFSNDFSKFLEWWVEDKHGNKKAEFKDVRDEHNEKSVFIVA